MMKVLVTRRRAFFMVASSGLMQVGLWLYTEAREKRSAPPFPPPCKSDWLFIDSIEVWHSGVSKSRSNLAAIRRK